LASTGGSPLFGWLGAAVLTGVGGIALLTARRATRQS
ncbi:MAG: hypothetical protein K0S70_4317, partial [Microbacterium sp.]|nr:hypothetical protein [Microbacterium sp.]